jgi:hypothetical protein
MSTALTLYERLTDAGEDQARARIVADAFASLEERLPARDTLATRAQLSETELRLTREIETLRKAVSEGESRLTERMGELKVDTIKWVSGLLLVQTGVLIGVMMGGLRLLLP